MKRFKLTKASKVLILILALALVAGGVFGGLKTGFIKMDKKDNPVKETVAKDDYVVDYDENGNVMNLEKETDATINLSLDEWIG